MIDIIIVNFKGYEMTNNLIENILTITKEPDYHVYVVDNSKNNDEFIKMKEKYIEKEKVSCIQNNSENTSYPAAGNIIIKKSENDIVLMNNDIILYDKDWLKKLKEVAYSKNNIGLVELGDINVVNKIKRQPTNIFIPFSLNIRHDYRISFHVCYFKRKLINDIGLIDEENFRDGGSDDVDYCFRARIHGYDMDVAWSDHKHIGSIDTIKEFGIERTMFNVQKANDNFNKKWKHLGVRHL